MNRNDIIRMAREAEVPIRGHYDEQGLTPQELERFAALVAAAERDACAKVCEEQGKGRKAMEHYAALTYSGSAHDCAAAIRARGKK